LDELLTQNWLTIQLRSNRVSVLPVQIRTEGRDLVDNNIAPTLSTSASWNIDARSGQAAGDVAPRLTLRTSLVLIFLLSLGLWGAIWLAACSLAAAWFG
jgi:hypothetical protein